MLTIENSDELKQLIQSQEPFWVIGKGSNSLLNPQATLPKLVKLSPDISPVFVEGACLHVNAGTTIKKLITLSQQAGLSGLEFVAGVPASLGGMITMNFGCWGHEIADVIQSVTLLDETGKTQVLSARELGFAYRSSHIQKKRWVVLSAVLKLAQADPETVKKRCKHVSRNVS